MKLFNLLIFLSVSLKSCFNLELFSSGAALLGMGVSMGAYYLKCKQYECCTTDWIEFNESKLAEDLKKNLYGQHLAESVIRKSLHGFFKNKNPKKALVMAFNGLTGSGKNYVSSIIANSTYREGTGSSYVHIYSGFKDFPHKNRVSEYQDKLRKEIVQFTKKCERSLFIFDEVDKMPPGVLDALKPYIDYYEQIDGVDYRKNIFLFLSNAGSSSIVGLTLKFWAEGRDREEITMRDIEPIVHKGAFNEEGGFLFSELLRSELVDVYVPFLPLERRHVYKCIEAELKSRNSHFTHKLVETITDDLVYFPEETDLYSTSGCKRIPQKVDLYID